MIDEPTNRQARAPRVAVASLAPATMLPVLALVSAALVFIIMLMSLLFPGAAAADAGIDPANPAVVVIVDDAGEVTYKTELPYDRDSAAAFDDQRQALTATAAQSPVRAGSAVGLAALAIAALAWAAMLVVRAASIGPKAV